MNDLLPIEEPYLLCINIESYCDSQGTRYLSPLWEKDLKLHLRYIKDLRLACPCRRGLPPQDAVVVEAEMLAQLQFIDLPTAESWIEAMLKLPFTTVKLWIALKSTQYVHLSIAGWVIPYAWIVTPMLLFQPSKFSVVIVESAPWRGLGHLPVNLFERLKSALFETLGRWCVNRSDLAIFTQEAYRQSFRTRNPERGHVIHASWIDPENIVSVTAATQLWQAKTALQRLNVIFVGRLVVSKGVLVLLDALQLLNQSDVSIQVTIVGAGELFGRCQFESQQMQGPIQLQVLEPISYDHNFWSVLQTNHVLVVPSLSDEQPRIVYDAYSQALPVIASRTPGLRDCVQHQRNGMLFEPNDAEALANLLHWSCNNLSQLETLGMAARVTALGLTHWKMHQRRWKLLAEQSMG